MHVIGFFHDELETFFDGSFIFSPAILQYLVDELLTLQNFIRFLNDRV